MDRRGDRARNILIRCPATYNGGVNLRARLEIHHDESGGAVRRATENGNGALVVPLVGRAKSFGVSAPERDSPKVFAPGGNYHEMWLSKWLTGLLKEEELVNV